MLLESEDDASAPADGRNRSSRNMPADTQRATPLWAALATSDAKPATVARRHAVAIVEL